LRHMVDDCRPSIVLTVPEWIGQISDLVPDRLPISAWNGDLNGAAPVPAIATEPEGSESVAFIQYTSGSTKNPRGIVVTHGMVAANLAQVAERYQESETDVAVTWVPLYHDMGLVTGLLRPLSHGYGTVLLRPESFAADPMLWLETISAHSGTLSSAPNFGYDLCVRKDDRRRAAALDLSSWRIARNAGEVVHASTADAFAATFADAGFKATAFCPSYGMAEATLTVTTCTPNDPPRRTRARAETVGDDPGPSTAAYERLLLSSGTPVPGTEVRIEGTNADGVSGPILVRGEQTFSRYWGRAPHPRSIFTDEGWMRTGDIGMMEDGHLFVLGRDDDVVISLGRKFYIGTDLLPACAKVPGLRPGRAALFEVRSDDASRMHLVAEVRKGTAPAPDELRALRRRLQQVVVQDTGLFLNEVHFAPAGSLPVTTSGKVRHAKIRDRFIDGSLELID
jgi:acyl-CoA synthetase (AMP-forming)/AMP-acid ligase II